VRARDLRKKEQLQAAVRQVAAEYLTDPNITSVGLGHKYTNGERTDTLALQFTVGVKVGPEAVEALGSRRIPERLTVNGMAFETDVVERDFHPHPTPVAEVVKDVRKQRIDPVSPGVSIANTHVTAGTLGCLVSDQHSGETLLLSNWHVFQGDKGALGDSIVQPGPYDDNRVDQDQVATLVRSFLGLAGDCALARPTGGRAFTDVVLDLEVGVHQIADPELDDHVVKSGRTTGVTSGIVTRIHTITKLDYGPIVGEQQIGGFEIGPDPERPAANGEISMGGDSGSAWLLVDDDRSPTTTMLGLHFAGETVEPAEYALACYASSVFSKLEVRSIEAEVAAVARAGDGLGGLVPGYNPDFLSGFSVAIPTPSTPDVADDYAPTRTGMLVRDYTHFSLALSMNHRFARWVAWNIDGGEIKKLSRVGINFRLDPDYEAQYQVDDDLYDNNRLDRGHIARRADLVWGSSAEAERANVDSFYFPNITPQLDDFNQEAKGGIWGRLEDAIFADVDIDDLRVSLFGGPIFKPTDFPYRDVLVPRSFWKVIVYVDNQELRAKAFVLTQDDLEAKLESLGLEEFKVFQTSIADLSERIFLSFGPLAAADTIPPAREEIGAPPVRRIRTPQDVT
jgi:endonuclease G, mitochondrial